MLRWDIFCRVIDNFGDLGVCWRLSAALAARGHTVQLWADDASALAWMAPDRCSGVEVRFWRPDQPMPHDALPGDVVIEAFGCEIDQAWFAMKTVANYEDSMLANTLKGFINPVWINLEYLSAEDYVERSHGLNSPVMVGAAQGRCKWFFYPGFTARTGGLIREYDAASVHADRPALRRISLFCYEPPALTDLLQTLADGSEPIELMALPGRGLGGITGRCSKQ